MAGVEVVEVTTESSEVLETTVVLDVTDGKRPVSYIIDKTFLEESISLMMSAPLISAPAVEPSVQPKSRMAKLSNKIKTMFSKKKRVVRYSLR